MTKQELQEVRFSKQRILALERKIEHYREMAEQITAKIDPNGAGGGGNGGRSVIEENVCSFVDFYNESKTELERYLALCQKAETQISQIKDSQQKSILEMRYICGYNWQQIAEALEIDERWMHRIHGKALVKIEEFDQL